MELYKEEIELSNLVSKLYSINKGFKETINAIYAEDVTEDKKEKMLEIFISLTNTRRPKIPTTNYDNKPYTMIFIKDFLEFIMNGNDLTKNEMKAILAIYLTIEEANAIANCLLSVTKKKLAEKSGMALPNLCRAIKGLAEKNVLKETSDGSLYINYNYFFKGSKVQYDMYKQEYGEL